MSLATSDIDFGFGAPSDFFRSQIETEGKAFRVSRAGHWEHHVEQIEKALV